MLVKLGYVESWAQGHGQVVTLEMHGMLFLRQRGKKW